MRLVAGRDISWDDNKKDLAVVVINKTIAKYLWPGQDPIGRIAEVAGADAQVIGVVENVHETNASRINPMVALRNNLGEALLVRIRIY